MSEAVSSQNQVIIYYFTPLMLVCVINYLTWLMTTTDTKIFTYNAKVHNRSRMSKPSRRKQ